MQKISILSLCLVVLTTAQQQPQVVPQQPHIVQQQPHIVQQQPKTPTKTENGRVASPFNVINSMYDITPLRVQVFNWFSSWFSTPTPFG
jgi:hypothetical protein